MRAAIIVAIFASSCNILVESSYIEKISNYHAEIGIPLAAKVKNAEDEYMRKASKIAGGSPALIGMFPYQVALLVSLVGINGVSLCGGSVLTNTRILTAAHCWISKDMIGNEVTVVLGSVTAFYGGTRIVSTDIDTHAEYDYDTLNNDIAIIKTARFEYTSAILPVVLPTMLIEEDLVGKLVAISGFGRTGDIMPITMEQFLSYTYVEVVPNQVCTARFGPDVVVNSTLCLSGENGRSTCQSDSGGPAVYNYNGMMVQIGVVSFGGFSCESGTPTGYARLTSYLSWIVQRL